MSTPNTVKAQLQNLIELSNRTTGKSDMNLTGAVNTLVNTYTDEHALRESILARSVTEIESDIKSLTSYALYECTNLTRAYFPNVTYLGGICCAGCKELVDIYLPKAQRLNGRIFDGCLALEYIDLPSIFMIYGANTFRNCSLLKTVVLRYSSALCSLENINSFEATPISSGTGYIYVPRELLSDTDETKDYRRATNWTTFASQFRVLEDYTVDGTIDGELDWNKVNGGTA